MTTAVWEPVRKVLRKRWGAAQLPGTTDVTQPPTPEYRGNCGVNLGPYSRLALAREVMTAALGANAASTDPRFLWAYLCAPRTCYSHRGRKLSHSKGSNETQGNSSRT